MSLTFRSETETSEPNFTITPNGTITQHHDHASLDQQLPHDHEVRAVWHPVQELDFSAFHARVKAVEGRPGKPPFRPDVLFALDRTLVNTSYVAIPANAGDPEGAAVVADLLLDPRLQAIKADPDVLGIPSVLDPERLGPEKRAALEPRRRSPYLLPADALGEPLAELPAAEVGRLEERWRREVLR